MKSQKVYKYFKKSLSHGENFHTFIFKDKDDKYILVETPFSYQHSISNVFFTEKTNPNNYIGVDDEYNCKLFYMNPYKDTYNSETLAKERIIDDADLCLLLME